MRWISLVALLTAVGSLGAGCGGDDDNGDQGASQTGAAMKDESIAMKDESGGAMKDEGKMKGEAMSQEAAMESEASASAANGRLIKAVGSSTAKSSPTPRARPSTSSARRARKRKCYGACAAAWPPVLQMAPRRKRRHREPARHDQTSERQTAGDLRRPAALLLRRRHARQHPLPERERIRRPLADRPAPEVRGSLA